MSLLQSVFTTLACVFLSGVSHADVRLPALFGNHMVVQRDVSLRLWGWADPGETVQVTASWQPDPVQTEADAEGRWATEIQAPSAGGPHRLVFQGRNEIVCEDVYSGEVWICSGQSNMDWSVSSSEEPEATAARATDPMIRLFDVEDAIQTAPADDVAGSWQVCSPETVTTFSAVAFHFGTRLRAELADVPIGLISTNWGGTVAESWTSAEGLADFEEFQPAIQDIATRATEEGAQPSLDEQQADWWANLEKTDPGFEGQWMSDQNGIWRITQVPLEFTQMDMGDFDGVVWLRRDVVLDNPVAGQACFLELGPIDDMDLVFWDGELVGGIQETGAWQQPRSYELRPEQTSVGTHALVIAVIDTGGVGSIGMEHGEPFPMALVGTEGETLQSLTGEWSARQGSSISELGTFPRHSWGDVNGPTMLFNGMIAPLVPYSIRGAIWYQGESNRTRAEQYRTLFPAMIRDWRNQWGVELPFYYVQIAPYAYPEDIGEAALLREAQSMALELPATGMVVTMDIGNPDDIHPFGKNVVGGRLGNLALRDVYGLGDLRASAPRYASMEVEGAAVRLRFNNAPEGLALSAGDVPTHFTVAGADQVFHPAEARIEGSTLLVQCAQVSVPVAVRFAWGAADQPNLCDGAEPGLPISSFRTDSW